MADKLLKVIDAFASAKKVDHYYWLHTDGNDHANDCVSIENIQAIIQIITGYEIHKDEVDVASEFHRAFVERFDGGRRNYIWVMKGETESWKRFSTVKELCHLLIDGDEDFQSDPCVTIEEMNGDTPIFDEHSANEVDSEALAEMIAMELIYPLDHSRDDKQSMDDGESLKSISAQRKVPEKYISLGVSEAYYKACMNIWSRLPEVTPANLDDKI